MEGFHREDLGVIEQPELIDAAFARMRRAAAAGAMRTPSGAVDFQRRRAA
jgi:hypothetical protein